MKNCEEYRDGGEMVKTESFPYSLVASIREPYTVYIVVNQKYGEKLRDLPADRPIWVVDSEMNHSTIQSLWKERKHGDYTHGITSFKFDENDKPEDWLLNKLSTIDLHHGEMSHDPPYSVVEVIGIGWSDRIEKKMKEFNFAKQGPTVEGFRAIRKLE